MKSKYIICVIALLVVVSNAGRQAVWAGPPASTGNSSATIKGVVKFEGVAPKSKPINMAADPSCAKQHPMPISAPEILTDGNGLQNAIVFVADGLGDHSFEPPSQPVVIEQKGCMYQPHVIAMRANQKLEVVNDDPTTHNIHPQPANNREWNKAEPPGARVEDTFTREEIAIPVKCNVHPWMRSYVAVLLRCCIQTSLLRCDGQGWQLRFERPAARDLHPQGLARETRYRNPAGHRWGKREQDGAIRF